ncbi:MHYT domain-containing protein [Marinimicrobium alkaliphilum]|uniref:MHYT domain-containing protein n=1 Tax=Marinimicrobium alkaliphilum TaxID=2202654 RepID=UPI000DB96DD4|nr:MHYT domain-containing protein [Marinimicrobium alkaliphilum]
MTGSYDPLLVFASYCVAVIAAYSAIYFGTRLFDQEGRGRTVWLSVGALCLGSGVWSMHFVGMSAYEMPHGMDMSFSAGLTLLSWVPAVLASGLALYVITLPNASARTLAASAMIMGTGIFFMHYGGMYAMRMEPTIQYDTLLVILSGLIAVGASGAALVICRQIRNAPPRHALWIKIVAALVMGAAIAGMHYTGMAAASYPADSAFAPSNELQGDWMGVPTAIAASGFLLLALFVAYQDYRESVRLRELAINKYRVARETAFNDEATGLPNRAQAEKTLLDRLTVSGSGQKARPFTLVYFELSSYRQLMEDDDNAVAQALLDVFVAELKRWFGDAELLARYGRDSFVLLVEHMTPGEVRDLLQPFEQALAQDLKAVGMSELGRWGVGFSRFPESGSASRNLLKAAQRVSLHFGTGVAEVA